MVDAMQQKNIFRYMTLQVLGTMAFGDYMGVSTTK